MRTARTFGCWLAFAAAFPALAQPALQFTAIRALASNQVELVWSSDVNRLFAIERATDPGDWENSLCVAIPEPSAQFASNHWTGAMDATPGFFRLLASPPLDPSVVCHANLGTPANDTQFAIGTSNRDYVMQFGNAGDDTQYASGGEGNDWIAQYGGTGIDSQQALGGTGDDSIYQQGGEGDDSVYANAGDGDDWIIQQGGHGNDSLHVFGDTGDDFISQNGGDGDDTITYYVSTGSDGATIDGGADTDTLTVNENDQRFVIQLGDGTMLYSNGPPGTVITVTNVEFIYVVGTNGVTKWSWTSP